MIYSQHLEKKLEEQTKNLQDCLEYLRALQLHALNHPEQCHNSLTQRLESIQDTLSIMSAECVGTLRILSRSS